MTFPKLITVSIWIICAIIVWFFIADIFLYRHPVTLKPSFEIGKCYKFSNDNPFEKREAIIKILDIKGRYIQYCYLGSEIVSSSPISLMKHIYEEIPCEDCKEVK